jgi:predicted transcriptional regulator
LETKKEECEELINAQYQLKKENKTYDKTLIKEKKKELKEIEDEIKDTEKTAQKLIDFDNKILIVQDTPSPQFFNMLMTILSQDSIRDQEYAFTDKSSNGKLFANKNRIRGMPVIMTTQVIDDTDNARFEEKIRRFIHISPSTSAEKIREANRLTGFKYGYLKTEYDKLVVSRADIARTKQIVKIVIAKLKQQKEYLGPKESGVKIPFVLSVMGSLPVEDGEVWQMTVGERTMKYLSMITKLNMDNRPRLVHKETEAFYPISTFEDLRETMILMERGGSKVRPYLQQWYNDEFVKAIAKQNGEVKEGENIMGLRYKELIVGVTTDDLSKETGEDPNVIRKKFLDPLVNLGLVQRTPSVTGNRTNIYSLPEYGTAGNTNKQDKNKILVKDSTLYPTKNLIVESLRTVVSDDADDPLKNKINSTYEILDENGQSITPEELADRYFANPEEYFDKDFPS